MRAIFRALALLLCVAGPSLTFAKDNGKMHHATGTFEVKITPEAHGDAPSDGVPTARMGLHKTFIGGFVGEATGTMLSAGVPKAGSAAAYVAIDQFTGALDGKVGGFVALHQGVMTKSGGAHLNIAIASDSGTGALVGIEGTMTIDVKDGTHFYDIAYRIPAKP
jgi:hypothetical protein